MSLQYTGGLGKRPGYQFRPTAPAKPKPKVPITLNPNAAPAWQSAAQQFAAGPQLPFNANAAIAQGIADRTYRDTSSGLDLQEQQLHEGYDDPTNPYNKLAMMKRAYDQTTAATGNSLAARGHLYSGLLQTEQNNNLFNYNREGDAAQRAFNDALARIKAARATATANQQNAYDASNFSTLGTGQ